MYHVLAKKEGQHSLNGLSSEMLGPISLGTRILLLGFKIRLPWLNTLYSLLCFVGSLFYGIAQLRQDVCPIQPQIND